MGMYPQDLKVLTRNSNEAKRMEIFDQQGKKGMKSQLDQYVISKLCIFGLMSPN